MRPVDSAAQCPIEYDGKWFLCPRYKRAEALAHFAQVDDRLSKDEEYVSTDARLLCCNRGPNGSGLLRGRSRSEI